MTGVDIRPTPKTDEVVHLWDLKEREGNPNEMTQEKYDALRHSIERNGYVQPIIVNQDNVIVDGAHRCRVLKDMDWNEIEVIRIWTKSKEDLALISQTMNKLHGSHEIKKDLTELELLMGYAPDDMQKLLSFDETSLDIMRQELAERELMLLRDIEEAEDEKEHVEFQATKNGRRGHKMGSGTHVCPKCGCEFD